jgi:hypothetical protein
MKEKEEVRGKKGLVDITMHEMINFKVDVDPSILPSRDIAIDCIVKGVPLFDFVHHQLVMSQSLSAGLR